MTGMPKRTAAIRVSRRLKLAPERVFRAWLDPELAKAWLFATAARPMTSVAIDPRVAGAFRLIDGAGGEPVSYTGEYLEIVPPRRLAFTLSAEHHPRAVTRVRVEIVPRATGCDLTVINEGVPPHYAGRTEARWMGILYGLEQTLRALDPEASPAPLRRSKR